MTWTPLDLLPGLYVLLLAAALAGALRRWFDPVPWRVLAPFLLVIAILFGPALFAGWTLLPLRNVHAAVPFQFEAPVPYGNWMQGDLVFQIAPWILEVRKAVAAGHWPLWNGGSGIGMPLMGDPQSQFIQPLVLLAAPFAIEPATAITASLRVLVALVFTFLFLRRQGLGQASSAAGAAAYGLGGFLMLWLGWPIGNVAAFLPAVLYGVARCDDPGGRRDHVLLFAALLAVLLGGHPETMMYTVVLAGFLLLARSLARTGFRARWALLSRGGVTFLLAGLVAAPILLLAQEYLPKTHRARLIENRRAGRGLTEVAREMTHPRAWAVWRTRTPQRLLPVAAPHSFGDLREFWGDRNVIEDQCGFAGVAPLLAAGAALWPLGRRRRFPHERFFTIALVVSLALLAQPPGFDRLFLRLPVIGMTAVHLHLRLLMVVGFCVAVLAAAEVERWRRGEGRRAAVAAAALGLAGLILWAYLGNPSPKTGRVVTGFLDGGMAAQLAALGLAAVLLWTRFGARSEAQGERRPGQAAVAFAVLCAAELLLVHGYANPPIPERTAYPVNPPVRFLQENLGTWRMMGLGNTFLANLPLVYGLRDIRTDNPSQPAAHGLLTQPLNRSLLAPRFGRPRHALYDLLGVRYMMTRPGLKLPFHRVFEHPAGWVWERPRALPPLFLPRRARVFRGREGWIDWVRNNTDFAARALVQASPGHNKHWRSRAAVPARLDLVSIEGARIRARADLGEPRLLATSILQDGNWHLLVDGQRTPTVLANGPLLAGWLPAGRHEVELLYRPWRLLLGLSLAALALTVVCALWIPPPRRPESGWYSRQS